MNVEAILKGKGRLVRMVRPEVDLREAVALLRRHAIGALVVSRDGERVEGIISERDIVLALADHGMALLEQRVETIMSRRITACRPDDDIADLMGLMTERRIRHLPVIDEGRLCGIVSIGDVVKSRLDEVEYEASSMRSFIAGV
ncbi:MAG TPA: CBS domain-containing protein [Stellaceae bacterium]|nr:CBS domain-containing protein [Stellaceae bacterium]